MPPKKRQPSRSSSPPAAKRPRARQQQDQTTPNSVPVRAVEQIHASNPQPDHDSQVHRASCSSPPEMQTLAANINIQALAQEIIRQQSGGLSTVTAPTVSQQIPTSVSTASTSSASSEVANLIQSIFQGNQGEPVREGDINNEFIPVSDGIPLGAEVSAKIKSKIWEDEFFDLRLLLPNQAEEPLSVTIESQTISLKQGNKPRHPLSIYQWTDAFHTFICIYLEKHPNEAANLLKYCHIIRDIHKCADDQAWRSYDESFRRLRQTSKLPWQKPVEELRMKAISGLFRKAPRENFRGRSNQFRFGGKSTKHKFCFAFNKGERCNAQTCQYLHACSICRNAHPKTSCRQNGHSTPWQRTSTGSTSTNPSKITKT